MSSLDLCCIECRGWAAEFYEPRIAELKSEVAMRDRMLNQWWEWEIHHGINPSMSKAAWIRQLREDPYVRSEGSES